MERFSPQSGQAANQIRELNTLVERMMHTRRDLLERKGICSKQELLRMFKLDMVHILNALWEVHDGSAELVTHEFFGEAPALIPVVNGALQHNFIYHLGFECYEPLDLLLYGFEHWMKRTREQSSLDIHVSGYQRFTASNAFEHRVGATTEILRIWVKLGERELMLELFDIHRPHSANELLRTGMPVNRAPADSPVRRGMEQVPRIRTALSLSQDPVWHYALYAQSAERVHSLHSHFQQLVAESPHYRLAYQSPVENAGDGSVHTKLLNVTRRLELEIVNQHAPGMDPILRSSDLATFQRVLHLELRPCPL